MEELKEVKISLFKNSSFLLTADFIKKICEFAFLIIIVRYLTMNGFGIYSYWLSLSGIIFFVIDFGAGTLIIREIAIDPEATNSYFINTLVIKILLSSAFIAFSFILILIIIDDPTFLNAGYLMIISLIIKTFNQQLFYPIFRAHERMGYQAIGSVIDSFSKLGLSFFLFYNNNLNVIHISIFDLSSNLFTLVFCILVLYKSFFIPKFNINKHLWFEIFKNSIYFGLIGIIIQGIFWIDITVLLLYKGDEAVAIYNAALKLIQPLLIISVVASSAIFPALSKYYRKSLKVYGIIFSRYLKYLLLLAFPLGIVISIYSEEIITLLYGIDYIEASIPLQFLAWFTVLVIVYGVFRKYFESSNKQKFLVIVAFSCMILDFILNLILVPILSYIGTSISQLISIITLVLILYLKIHYDKSYKQELNLNWSIKVGISFISLAVFSIITKYYFLRFLNLFWIFILLSATLIFYIISLLLLKIIDLRELKMLISSYKKLYKIKK